MRLTRWAEEKAVRERAYLIWQNEGRPHGRAEEHWRIASAERPQPISDNPLLSDLEAIVDGRAADYPAVLAADARGG